MFVDAHRTPASKPPPSQPVSGAGHSHRVGSLRRLAAKHDGRREPGDMSQDHEFAQFLRTIGRGPQLSRPLDRAEAPAALRLVLEGRVDPVQLGAFPLVLRYRGETPEELAGMIEAARETFSGTPPGTPAGGTPAGGTPAGPPAGPVADLDWPSYADRHRQQPWFVLAARLRAVNGVTVLMHGIAGYSDGYAPTRPALAALALSALGRAEDRTEAQAMAETM